MKLEDFMKMSRPEFWTQVKDNPLARQERLERCWEKAKESVTHEEAVDLLDMLWRDSHYRILQHSGALAKNYPTKQFNKNRLAKVEDLWWTDHFTAGISRWSTLNWFSAAKRKKKNGKMGYAGASTHFVQGYHGLPFYIIPLMHGAWHEPNRNKDSISIEFVNAGGVSLRRQGSTGDRWHYWARALPMALVRELPPVQLDKPYRGVRSMQPFTEEQLQNAVVLKRIVIAALNIPEETPRLDSSRFSQHSDWRAGKSDMGPLWPHDDINAAAFGTIPVEEYDFLQSEEYTDYLDDAGTLWDEIRGWEDENEMAENPEYGEATVTHDDDETDEDRDSVLSIRNIQSILTYKGYPCKTDGKMGPKTRKQLIAFQRYWNSQHSGETLKVDGKPGPKTCSVLLA